MGETLHTKLKKLEQWFDNYVHRFDSDNTEIQQNFHLKILHTKKVCQNIQYLARELELNDTDYFIASCAALFHDIGRFEQFQKYKTFADKLSVDHAELGLEIIHTENIFKDLPESIQTTIITAIQHHNKLAVPGDITKHEEYFTRLLRDADKMDIFRVVIEYYEQMVENKDQNHAVVLGLPNNDDFSDEVIEDILRGEIVQSQDLKTVNDFKLLQMAWIFDINFVPSFRYIAEKQFIEQINSHLPKHPKILEAYKIINHYMKENCNKEINSILF